ncbi:MAG: hypothetical protein ACRC2T_19745 [Thermoguttaceae bacterium]
MKYSSMAITGAILILAAAILKLASDTTNDINQKIPDGWGACILGICGIVILLYGLVKCFPSDN